MNAVPLSLYVELEVVEDVSEEVEDVLSFDSSFAQDAYKKTIHKKMIQ